jgi:Domain of unknown function (DU1801)
MVANKTQAHEASVETFLAAVEPAQRRTDGQELCRLMAEVSGEFPKMWGPSIVGFGQYSYRYESGREGTSLQIGFSPRKPSLVLYGLGIERNADLIDRLGNHTTGKGCLYIKRLSDVDPTVLRDLIAEGWARRETP